MGIYVPTLLGAGGIGVGPDRPTDVSPAQYNAAYEDQNGTAFPAGFTAAQVAASLRVVTTPSAADSLVISPLAAVVLKTTGGDAEALTLADGTEIGEIITIQMVVDAGGVGTLTVATSTTFATVVFADVADTCTLQWRGSTLGWVILGCYGLTAQPTITVPAP